MVREILTLSIGQAGIQLAQCVWKQYCVEHEINYDGTHKHKTSCYWKKDGPTKILTKNNYHYNQFETLFEETGDGLFVPRSLMVDLEPNVIDDVKTSNIQKLFDSSFMLSGSEDAANNFARGHYTIGKEMIETITDQLRKLIDHCDNIRGFFINHSVGGGTGSGLGSLILERISVDYRKKGKVNIHYPSKCFMAFLT